MAQRITLTADVQSLSGKEGRNSNVVVALSKKTGRMVRYSYVKPSNPNTTKQQAKRTAFTNIAKNLGKWWQQQKPTTSQADGTEAYKTIQKAFKADNDFDNVFSFLRSKYVSKAGILTVGTTTVDLTTSSTTGGSSSNSGDEEERV